MAVAEFGGRTDSGSGLMLASCTATRRDVPATVDRQLTADLTNCPCPHMSHNLLNFQ